MPTPKKTAPSSKLGTQAKLQEPSYKTVRIQRVPTANDYTREEIELAQTFPSGLDHALRLNMARRQLQTRNKQKIRIENLRTHTILPNLKPEIPLVGGSY